MSLPLKFNHYSNNLNQQIGSESNQALCQECHRPFQLCGSFVQFLVDLFLRILKQPLCQISDVILLTPSQMIDGVSELFVGMGRFLDTRLGEISKLRIK